MRGACEDDHRSAWVCMSLGPGWSQAWLEPTRMQEGCWWEDILINRQWACARASSKSSGMHAYAGPNKGVSG